MKNYTFIKPFKTTIGSKDANALLMGATPFKEINFKIGDKINGSPFGGLDTNRVIDTRVGNANINIPPEYLKEEADNQTVQPLAVTDPELFKKNMELSAKKDEKMKQLKYGVIAVVLIAGYFAYKKFKK